MKNEKIKINKGFAVTKDRNNKAKKIEAILTDFLNEKIVKKNILDLGTGSGLIADYFSEKNEVYSIDVEDQRIIKDNRVLFRLADSEKIPLPDSFFEIVISNHVIEHVSDQKLHLCEIKRVLKRGGICYLATPNRLFPIEPHYKIPLIHYLPNPIFFKILKIIRIYHEDISILSYNKLITLCKKYFQVSDYTKKIILEPKKFFYRNKLIKFIPPFLLNFFAPLSPTIVLVLKNR